MAKRYVVSAGFASISEATRFALERVEPDRWAAVLVEDDRHGGYMVTASHVAVQDTLSGALRKERDHGE